MGAVSGVVIFIARFSEKTLFSALANAALGRKDPMMNYSLIPYAKIFEKIEQDTEIQCILQALCDLFSRNLKQSHYE